MFLQLYKPLASVSKLCDDAGATSLDLLQLNSSFVPGVILPFRHFLSIPLYKAGTRHILTQLISTTTTTIDLKWNPLPPHT